MQGDWIKGLRPAVVLTIICIAAGTSLAATHALLNEQIQAVEQAEVNKALSEIFPLASFEEEAGYYRALENGALVGYAAIAEGPGYGATFGGCDIKLVFGVGVDGVIKGVRVIVHSETPGLGSKIAENEFLGQFVGKSLGELALREEGGEIDAITGATISSRSVVRILREKLEELSGVLEVSS